MGHDKTRANFDIGTEKINESIVLHEQIDKLKAEIASEKEVIINIKTNIEARKQEDAQTTAEIKSLEEKVREIESNLNEIRTNKSKLETQHKSNLEALSSLDKRRLEEEGNVKDKTSKAEQLKMRSESLYKEGHDLISNATGDLEKDVPNDVKEGTIEVPQLGDTSVRSTSYNTSYQPQQSHTETFGGHAPEKKRSFFYKK
jgi:chromosome segregation ATPase